MALDTAENVASVFDKACRLRIQGAGAQEGAKTRHVVPRRWICVRRSLSNETRPLRTGETGAKMFRPWCKRSEDAGCRRLRARKRPKQCSSCFHIWFGRFLGATLFTSADRTCGHDSKRSGVLNVLSKGDILALAAWHGGFDPRPGQGQRQRGCTVFSPGFRANYVTSGGPRAAGWARTRGTPR
ncbi:hypothetical protein VUR80DRAFT_7858 [Thermomyces stellatus]